MGDIDFDELDKAVNSLMSSTDRPAADKRTHNRHSAPKASTVHRRQAISPSRNPAAKAETTQKSTTKTMDMRFTPNKTVPVAPAARRSGRFMDVVDSSSELNPLRQPLTPTPRDVARKSEPSLVKSEATIEFEPVQVTPPSVVTVNEVAALQPEMPRYVAPAESTSESVLVRQVPKNVPTPDPLQLLREEVASPTIEILTDDNESDRDDVRPPAAFGTSLNTPATGTYSIAVTNQRKVPMSLPESVQSVTATTPEEPHLNIVIEQDEAAEFNQEVATTFAASEPVVVTEPEAPQNKPELTEGQENESPFLLDAKVEKRPLSANQVATNETETETPIIIEQQPGEQSVVFENPELQVEDLMPSMPHTQPEVSEIPELSNELVAIEATGKGEYELDEAPVPIKSSTDGSQKLEQSKKPAVVGPTSISQQYQSVESSGDATHAPIYDTTEYAEPVAHPAKKKSGWMWVLAILFLLALGSGSAVVLYLTGIIP